MSSLNRRVTDHGLTTHSQKAVGMVDLREGGRPGTSHVAMMRRNEEKRGEGPTDEAFKMYVTISAIRWRRPLKVVLRDWVAKWSWGKFAEAAKAQVAEFLAAAERRVIKAAERYVYSEPEDAESSHELCSAIDALRKARGE